MTTRRFAGDYEGDSDWQHTLAKARDVVNVLSAAVDIRITKLPTGEQGIRAGFAMGMVTDSDRLIAELLAVIQGPQTRVTYEAFDQQTRLTYDTTPDQRDGQEEGDGE